MSHQILERDIQIGTELAWHKLTQVVESIDLRNNGIRYPMITVPNYVKYNGVEIPTGSRSIISKDDGLPIALPVGAKYQLLSNEHICDMVADSLVGVPYKVVSIGSINNRGEVFVSIEIDGANTVVAAGRETKSVLNVLWSHSGKIPVIAKTGLIVVVCANTQQMALNEKSDFSFRVKHTLNALDKLEGMEKAIDCHVGVTAAFKKAMDSLANIKCDTSRAERMVAGIISADGEAMSTRARNTVTEIVGLFSTGAGNRASDMSDVYNSLTDYYTHSSRGGDSVWRQFVSSEFCSGANSKREAYEILTNAESRKQAEKRGDKALVATAALALAD